MECKDQPESISIIHTEFFNCQLTNFQNLIHFQKNFETTDQEIDLTIPTHIDSDVTPPLFRLWEWVLYFPK